MALVRRDCILGARFGTHFLKRMHDLTEDAGDQGSLLSVSDLPCPGHFLSVSLFLSCLYVSSSAPLCSFSHDALPHHRLRKKQFTVHQNCEPRGRTFPCSLLGHFLTAVFSSDTHSRKRCHDSTRGGRVGVPGKTQLYRTENVIQHTQMAERTKIILEAVQYLWNPSLHLSKQGYSHTRLATGESKPPNKSGLLFWCKIIVL